MDDQPECLLSGGARMTIPENTESKKFNLDLSHQIDRVIAVLGDL